MPGKYLQRFVLLVCLLIAVHRCDAIELTVNELPNFAGQDVGSKAECSVVRRFMKDHPDIRLKGGSTLKIEGSANTMDMVPLMQIAGDISPSVIAVNFRMSDTYIQRGFLKPLDEYVAGVDQKELMRRVPPAVLDVVYRKGPDGKKHWYMLPTGSLVRVLAYRRDLFAKAGLDPNRPPRTWEELAQYSKRLTDPKKNRYGMVLSKGDISSWDFANFVRSSGSDIVTKDKDGNLRPHFNSKQVVDALYFYLKLTRGRWTRGGKTYRGVANCDVKMEVIQPGDPYAMAFAYLGDRLNVYQPEVLGYAPVPYPENGGRSSSEINCVMLGIYAGEKDPAVARAAFDYIWFLGGHTANAIRVKTYVQNGFGRFVHPGLLREFGYTDYLKNVDKEWVKVFEDSLVYGKPEPYGKNCSVVYRELSRPIGQASNDPAIIAALDRGDETEVKQRIKVILDRAQMESEKRMYGILPPKVRSTRGNLTWAFLAIAMLGFTATTTYLTRMFTREAPAQAPGQKKSLVPYLLLLPAVLGVLVWQYYPLLRGTIMAFQDYNIMGNSKFVGIDNFSTILFDPGFWHSIGVTLLYTALYMIFAFISPIFLALLLSEIPKGKVLFRTIFYLPTVLSGLVVVFLWKSFYKPAGLLNTLLGFAGIHTGVDWLDSPVLAMAAVLLPVVWAGLGPGSLIYIAALKTIPEEFYEAADLDGAGVIKKVSAITLPGLRMLIMINAIGAFIGAFMSSEMIFAMTAGGPYTPYGTTEVVGLQLFYTAFMYLKFGTANAMAWVLGFMLIGFTLLQLRSLSRVEFKGGR